MKKIIFFLQSEGRGHLTQALALKKILEDSDYQVIGCILGTTSGKKIPDYFKRINCPIWEIESPQFVKNNHKSISLTKTFTRNALKLTTFTQSLKEIELIVEQESPDIIINFYEILTGLWNLFYNRRRVPVVSVGHQFLLEHSNFKFPDNNKWQQFLIKSINTLTSYKSVEKWCLSFYDEVDEDYLKIIPPLMREEVLVRESILEEDFILVYLCNEGYLEEIKQIAKKSDQNFKVFMNISQIQRPFGNLAIYPLSDTQFLDEMVKCKGIMMTAGFESVCEAKYLNKPSLLVPIENHYEQKCNAFDAELAQAGKFSPSFNLLKLLEYIESYEEDNLQFNLWVNSIKHKVMTRLNLILS